jgi:hypothetical protein
MRTAKYLLATALALGMIANAFATRADDAKPKHTVKEIMKLAHKDGLYNKVKGGAASKEEKTELAELYADMVKNKAEKGDPESWKQKCEALASAAKDVAEDKPDALAKLKAANNCGACHNAHRAKK